MPWMSHKRNGGDTVQIKTVSPICCPNRFCFNSSRPQIYPLLTWRKFQKNPIPPTGNFSEIWFLLPIVLGGVLGFYVQSIQFNTNCILVMNDTAINEYHFYLIRKINKQNAKFAIRFCWWPKCFVTGSSSTFIDINIFIANNGRKTSDKCCDWFT